MDISANSMDQDVIENALYDNALCAHLFLNVNSSLFTFGCDLYYL